MVAGQKEVLTLQSTQAKNFYVLPGRTHKGCAIFQTEADREEMKGMENQILIRAGIKKHKGSLLGIGILLFLTALSLTAVLMTAFVGSRYIREEMERGNEYNKNTFSYIFMPLFYDKV